MKQRGFCWYVLLATVLLVGLLMAGCAKPAPSPSPAVKPSPAPAPAPAPWPKVISVGTAPSGATYYVVGAGWAETVSKYVKISVKAEVTPGAEANLKMIKGKEIELGIVNDEDAYLAPRGIERSAALGKVPVRLLFKSHKFELWPATRADSGIKTIEDLKGKRFMGDWVGAPVLWSYGKRLFECYGFDIKKDLILQQTPGWKEIMAAIAEKTTDAGMIIGTHPAPNVVSMAESYALRHLSASDKVLDCIYQKIPWAAPCKMPVGTYKGQTEVIGDVEIWTNFVITPDLPEDLVYQLTKATFEHLAELVPIHPAFKQVSLKNALTNPQMPYHSGAVKYYKEAGVWTSEMEATQSRLLKDIGAAK